jgi:predicted ATPase
MIALANWQLGYPDRAREHMVEAISLAREADVRIVLPVLLYYDLLIHMSPEDIPHALERCEELRKVSEELEHYWGPMALIHLGWCRAHRGEAEAGAELIRQGLEEWKAFGWRVAVVHVSALLAQALRLGGRADEGLRLLEDARSTTETVDDLWQVSEIHKTRGELMLALADPDPIGAEAAFRQAIEIARSHEARSDELRATTSLARLLRARGHADEARVMLNEIYGWFTEGFDTADLIEARDLIAELETG